MTGFVARVRNAISPSRHYNSHSEPTLDTSHSPTSTCRDLPEERGRKNHQQIFTTGRGGAGNLVRSGTAIDPNELSIEEGLVTHEERSKRVLSPRSHGRGGAGNIRSPSRDASQRAEEAEKLKRLDEEDRRIEEAYDERTKNSAHSTGRGGAGNIH
ncbi:hypothetical protein DFH28DRAFT_1119231 [Melampsora americana]|nr:hypothetical protein DFH28DRAFT_1119231 [Melampsora americana]